MRTADSSHLPKPGNNALFTNVRTTIIVSPPSGKIEFAGRSYFRKTNPGPRRVLERRKQSKRKRLLCWLLIDIAVAAVVFALLLYKPSRYHPVVSALPADANERGVHPYVSHELMPALYNGAQSRRPFEIVVHDKALNEALARARWSQTSEGITLSAPEVLFVPGHIVLMATANVSGAGLVVTVELEPQVEDNGRLNLVVEKVKVGAINVTPAVRIIARKMFQEQLDMGYVDTEDIRTEIVASLANGEPFEPVFLVEDKWVRLKSFEIAEGKLTAQFAPAK